MIAEREISKKSGKRKAKREIEFYDDGFLRVEFKNYYLACAEQPVRLTRGDFLIVSLLARKINQAVSPKAIWKHLCDNRKPFNSESLRVQICYLRAKLARFGVKIESEINRGYRLISPALKNVE